MDVLSQILQQMQPQYGAQSLFNNMGQNPLAAFQNMQLGQQPMQTIAPIQTAQASPIQAQLNNMDSQPQINTNSNASTVIQQQLGALPPPQPDTVSNILSGRFQNQDSGFGTDYGDYSQGIINSALGKPMVGPQIAQSRAADSLKNMEALQTIAQAPLKNQYIQSEIDKNKAMSGGLFGPAGSPAGSAAVTGDAYLATLPPQAATQVKALSEGRMQFPGGFALKSPYWQQMISAVSQYDPNFDAVNYNARATTRKDFTSGKSRQNLTRIDTAINTLGQLNDANDALGGSGIDIGGVELGNTARNMALKQASDPSLTKYNMLAKTAADEVSLAVGGGSSAVGDRENRLSSFTANQSPEARKTAIQTAIQELNARLDPVASAYNQGMGTSKNGVDLLTPGTSSYYNKIMGTPPAVTNAPGNYQDMPQSQNIQEGATAINPQTGHRIVFQNGQWRDNG